MKRFLWLLLSIWRRELKLYVLAGLIGAAVGLLVLAPSYDYINARENEKTPLMSMASAFKLFSSAVTGNVSADNMRLLRFYAEIGAGLGVASLLLYMHMYRHLQQIEYLKHELDKDLPSIIRQGEGPYLEFKSSLRWDVVESRVNRGLETVVLKTLAGFLNSQQGGVLLIGVADNGEILGLKQDFQTLRRQDADGFEQALMTAAAAGLGADVCPFLHVLFHTVEQKQVCRVIISPANRPVFLELNGAPRFFTRTGGGTRDLNVQEALAYASSRWKH